MIFKPFSKIRAFVFNNAGNRHKILKNPVFTVFFRAQAGKPAIFRNTGLWQTYIKLFSLMFVTDNPTKQKFIKTLFQRSHTNLPGFPDEFKGSFKIYNRSTAKTSNFHRFYTTVRI